MTAKARRDTSSARALEELYTAPPERFVDVRDALVRRLKEEGDAAAAAALRARRKPTRTAYVLNQLARRAPDVIAELVDLGRELARAERRAMRGEAGGTELREGIARQREAIGGLVRTTQALARELGLDGADVLDEVASALRGAMVDPSAGAALEEGMLEKAPEAAVGMMGIAPLAGDAPEAKPARQPPATQTRAPRGRRAAEARRGRPAAAALEARRAAEAKQVAAAKKAEEARARAAADQRADEERRAKEEAAAAAEEAAEAAEQEAQRATEDAQRAAAAAREAAREARQRAQVARKARREADAARRRARAPVRGRSRASLPRS